ncbi:MAG: hypothetical protein KDK12_09945 [Rhodobacteraceae bacterium]|nr:hypothetical protein [Paracoccaceae bacterium]
MNVTIRRPAARSLASATAMALCLGVMQPAPALAMTAFEAWAALQSLAAGAGLSITSTGVTSGDDAVMVSGVRIFPTADPNEMIVSMDSLQVVPRGEMIALTPSAAIDVGVLFAGGITRHFNVTHNGTIAGMLTETNAALDLDFPSLSVVQVPGAPAAKGGPADPMNVSMSFAGFTGRLRAAREGAAEATLDAGSVTYDLTYPDFTDSTATISQQGTIQSPHLALSATELDTLSGEDGALRRAFDSGFSASLEFSTVASQQTSSQPVEGVQVNIQTQGGASTLRVDLADGRVDITGDAAGLSLTGAYGPVAGSMTLGGMGLAFGLPLVVTPDDQPIRYMISLQDLAPSPELLSLFGAGQFAGDRATITVDVGAQGRLLQEIGPNFGESDAPPFDISSASLDDLRLQVGDSAFTGSGAVTLIGGIMGQIGRERPNADGRFLFDLVGGERLLTRLQAMGIVPQDQLFFVRMMMNGLSRPIGDDHLQSEVVLQPGGGITVNGAPLPF